MIVICSEYFYTTTDLRFYIINVCNVYRTNFLSSNLQTISKFTTDHVLLFLKWYCNIEVNHDFYAEPWGQGKVFAAVGEIILQNFHAKTCIIFPYLNSGQVTLRCVYLTTINLPDFSQLLFSYCDLNVCCNSRRNAGSVLHCLQRLVFSYFVWQREFPSVR